jgi:hypothetical protein
MPHWYPEKVDHVEPIGAVTTRGDLLRKVRQAEAKIENAVSRWEQRLVRETRLVQVRPEQVATTGAVVPPRC